MNGSLPASMCACALIAVLTAAADVGAKEPFPAPAADAGRVLDLYARSRRETSPKSGTFEVTEKPLKWEAGETAVLICDLWDKHWCERASARVGQIAPRIDALAKAVRAGGGLIVHAPSDTMAYYADAPQRKLAQSAPPAAPPAPMNAWKKLDPALEGPLPIDDSDGGCDCEPPCKVSRAWKREHPAVELAENDAVSDSGQEIYNLFRRRGIKHVLVTGVHTNMCVLGRSFGIRRLTAAGFEVALVRDLTDALYNHRMAPFVPHDRGTDLVVEHVEKYWCPTVLSSDVLGDPEPARVAFAVDEQEYRAKETLPEFARAELETRGIRCTFLRGEKASDLPGTEALASADLLVVFMRRTTLPPEQLGRFKAWLDAGKPVVALRTGCHAFQNYLDFDKDVLGCRYNLHYNNKAGSEIAGAPGAADSPLLRGVKPAAFHSAGSLYKVGPLADWAKPLLVGRFGDNPPEPVAWTNTHNGGRVFFTSLGHPDDFKLPAFRRLLLNGVLWALDAPIPTE